MTMLGICRYLSMRIADVVSHITDPLLNISTNEFENMIVISHRSGRSTQNKVGQFHRSTIRNIVGQPKSTISLNDIMDTKILLLDLSVGKIGRTLQHCLQ